MTTLIVWICISGLMALPQAAPVPVPETVTIEVALDRATYEALAKAIARHTVIVPRKDSPGARRQVYSTPEQFVQSVVGNATAAFLRRWPSPDAQQLQEQLKTLTTPKVGAKKK